MAKLYYKYGVMGSGKSLDLIRCAYNYQERGMNILIFKPIIDTREGEEGIIKSRTGSQVKTNWIHHNDDIFEIIKEYINKNELNSILIDEVQFLTEKQIEQLSKVVIELNIPVLCYGIKNDFRGYLFPTINRLLALCDDMKLIRSLCWCGKLAKQNARVIDGNIITEGEMIKVGGNESYISLCNKHFHERKLI